MKKTFLLPILFFVGTLCMKSPISYALDASLDRETEPTTRLGHIKDITVFAHPVCSFRRPTEGDLNQSIFAEGDICSLDGRECEYHALINMNGKDIKLQKQFSKSEAKSARFKAVNAEIEIIYGQTKCFPDAQQCETSVLNATLTVFQGKNIRKVKVIGACGD